MSSQNLPLSPGEIYSLVTGCLILTVVTLLAVCSVSDRAEDVPFVGEDDNV